MQYHDIPEEDWESFYNWYSKTYPHGDKMVSTAYDEYKEWKNNGGTS
jgi:hypothetical protein